MTTQMSMNVYESMQMVCVSESECECVNERRCV